jgi:hypothetical protein
MLAALALLAFIVGFAVHRGTNCSVVAARQLVRRRDPTRLASFVAGACMALVIAVPLAWSDPVGFKLAASQGITWAAVIGGACYGLGALLNGACALGTIVRISEGRLAFLATIPGAALGAYLATRFDLGTYRGAPEPGLMTEPNALATAMLISAGVITVAAVIATAGRMGRVGLNPLRLIRASRWHPVMAMLFVGAAGGLAFAMSDSWAWPALARRTALALAGGGWDFPAPVLIGTVALFAGGLTAALLSRRFRVRPGNMDASLRSLVGGAVMGSSAALIPGGNDVMLLHALPSLAVSGLVAYAAMLTSLVVVMSVTRRWRTVPERLSAGASV